MQNCQLARKGICCCRPLLCCIQLLRIVIISDLGPAEVLQLRPRPSRKPGYCCHFFFFTEYIIREDSAPTPSVQNAAVPLSDITWGWHGLDSRPISVRRNKFIGIKELLRIRIRYCTSEDRVKFSSLERLGDWLNLTLFGILCQEI
ncbi:hypothetical protein Tcan_00351 [Toxocara canis]|uniref:Uncharacterized protein n=1 Tax=Toxocara canis TaxID=6265 RepID=A0A0B2UIY4_TOXCA|nr:hypothetical protein Tcan_00351 [Toxocara canis]